MPSDTLDQFDTLTALGLKVIALRANSKIPLCRGWTNAWDKNDTRIKLQQYPDCNIGLLLGEVVDVEGDSIWANQMLTTLIGDYVHPIYTSTKSVHHLFVTPDPTLRLVKHRAIEFRGHGHQSVLPPSHHQGTDYQWLNPISEVGIPPMPERLLVFLRDLQRNKGDVLKPGHTGVKCQSCGKRELLHTKRLYLELEAFKELGQSWLCHACRTVDLRPLCRRIRRWHYKNHKPIPH